MLLAALSQTIVATAMPRIITDLGGFDRYTWASTAYLVASAIAVPIVGRLSDFYDAGFSSPGHYHLHDRFSPNRPEPNDDPAHRVSRHPGHRRRDHHDCQPRGHRRPVSTQERGKFQGLLGLVYGIASVIGPALGGFITDNLSWNWIFLFNVPAGIPVLLLVARTFPQIRPQVRKRSLDYPGMATLILAIVPILLALSWGGVQYEWGSPQTIGFLAFGLAMAVTFVVIESRSDSPLMPLDVYRNRNNGRFGGRHVPERARPVREHHVRPPVLAGSFGSFRDQ